MGNGNRIELSDTDPKGGRLPTAFYEAWELLRHAQEATNPTQASQLAQRAYCLTSIDVMDDYQRRSRDHLVKVCESFLAKVATGSSTDLLLKAS